MMDEVLCSSYKRSFKICGLPMPQRHPQSSPDCPTRPRGWPGRSETGSGTARSPSPYRRSFSVSCRSTAVAQSGTGASHNADKAENVNFNDNNNNNNINNKDGKCIFKSVKL